MTQDERELEEMGAAELEALDINDEQEEEDEERVEQLKVRAEELEEEVASQEMSLEEARGILERAGHTVVGPENGGDPVSEEREDVTPEEAVALSRDEKKSRLAQVLARGRVNSKVQSIVDTGTPEGRVGKLVRDTPSDIAAYRNIGYTFQTEDVEGMHGTGDGRVRVGDTVLMTISREDLEIIRELRAERVQENVGGVAQEEFLQKDELGYDDSRTRIANRR